MIPITKVSDQTRQRVHTLSNGTVVTQALGTLCFPTFSLLFSRSPGWQLLNQPFLLFVFYLSTQVSPVSHIASTIILYFHAVLRLSSALSNSVLAPVPAPLPASVPVPILYSFISPNPRSCNNLADYCSCAGGLSAVNAIGTQLRDPMNSALTRSSMYGGLNKL